MFTKPSLRVRYTPLRFVRAFLLARCVLCSTPTRHKLFPYAYAFVCENCVTQQLQPVPHMIESASTYPWRHLFAFTVYKTPFKTLVFQYKYRAVLAYALLFADAILYALYKNTTQYDAIIPMPLFSTKLVQRGFNQVVLIARAVAAYLGIPCYSNALIVSTQRTSQKNRNKEDRTKGMVNLFNPTKYLHAHRILLLDDIVTTGITITHASAALVQAGATLVDCATIALHKNGINADCIEKSFR